jgi:hypothetical protein
MHDDKMAELIWEGRRERYLEDRRAILRQERYEQSVQYDADQTPEPVWDAYDTDPPDHRQGHKHKAWQPLPGIQATGIDDMGKLNGGNQ